MKKKTNKEYVEEIKSRGLSIEVVGEYLGSSAKILHKCLECGNEWLAKPNTVLNGSGCPKCARVSSAEKQKKTHDEYVQELKAIELPFEVIEKYESSDTPILHRCLKCDFIWKARPNNVVRMKKCPQCSGNKRRTSEEYIELLKEQQIEIEPIEPYINSSTPILHRCMKCGYEWRVVPNSIIQGKGCPRCSGNLQWSEDQYVETVKEVNPNIVLVGLFSSLNSKTTHKCLVCDNEWEVAPSTVLKKHGCPVCSHNKIGKAPQFQNSIWASQYREIAQRFGFDEEKMKSFSPWSNKKTIIVCPTCGMEKRITFNDFFKRGLGCINCSDGVSFGEKYTNCLLSQIGVDYQYQYSAKWTDGKKYEFANDKLKWIIEVNGGQHYRIHGFNTLGGKTLDDEKSNDNFKESLAKQYGFDDYFIIDCSKSNYEYIKQSIIKSGVLDYFKVSEEEIDWKKCAESTLTSNIRKSTDLWNQGYSVNAIGKEMKMHPITISEYLNKGNVLGICNYDSITSRSRGKIGVNSKKVICIETGIVYDSITEAASETNTPATSISSCCRGRVKTAHGYHWEYYLLN